MIALADSRALRFGAFSGLYFAQGVPWGLFMVALPTWLAAEGLSSAQVGTFLATVSLPWTLKLLAGPLMDRFAYLPMGRRRPWVLIAQTGILLGALGLAFVPTDDPGGTSFYALLGAGFMINFSAAWQDVAVDGMAIDVLPEGERARANAFMFGGQSVGIAAASFGGAELLARWGLPATALVVAFAVALVALIPTFLRERSGERLMPWTAGDTLPRSLALADANLVTIVSQLVRVIILPMSILLVLIKFGDRVVVGLLNATFPVLTTQELGFDATFYPYWSSIGGIAAAVFGVLIAPIVDRVGAQRALFWGLLIKALVIGAAGMFAAYWSSETTIVAVVLGVQFVGQLLTVASIAIFMNLCSPKIAATQFAVYMASSNLALSAGSILLGPLDAAFSFQTIFLVAAGIDLALVALIPLFKLEQHRRRAAALLGEDEATPGAAESR